MAYDYRDWPEVDVKERNSSVGPPLVKGVEDQTAAVDGGVNSSLITSLSASAWDTIADRGQCVSDLQTFLNELDESPSFRAAATLKTLSRIRDALASKSEMCLLTEEVKIPLQDLALIARQLLSRLK